MKGYVLTGPSRVHRALIACMRKLVTHLNAIVRDHLNHQNPFSIA